MSGSNHSFLSFEVNVANKLSRIASTRRFLWGRCVARSTTANPTDSARGPLRLRAFYDIGRYKAVVALLLCKTRPAN
jgi:hypothetical protein